MLLIINFNSPDGRYDNVYLSNFATINVRDQLLRVEGVSDITVFGQRDYAMRLWLDPQQLAARNVTAMDVANAVRRPERRGRPRRGRAGPERADPVVPVPARHPRPAERGRGVRQHHRQGRAGRRRPAMQTGTRAAPGPPGRPAPAGRPRGDPAHHARRGRPAEHVGHQPARRAGRSPACCRAAATGRPARLGRSSPRTPGTCSPPARRRRSPASAPPATGPTDVPVEDPNGTAGGSPLATLAGGSHAATGTAGSTGGLVGPNALSGGAMDIGPDRGGRDRPASATWPASSWRPPPTTTGPRSTAGRPSGWPSACLPGRQRPGAWPTGSGPRWPS